MHSLNVVVVIGHCKFFCQYHFISPEQFLSPVHFISFVHSLNVVVVIAIGHRHRHVIHCKLCFDGIDTDRGSFRMSSAMLIHSYACINTCTCIGYSTSLPTAVSFRMSSAAEENTCERIVTSEVNASLHVKRKYGKGQEIWDTTEAASPCCKGRGQTEWAVAAEHTPRL